MINRLRPFFSHCSNKYKPLLSFVLMNLSDFFKPKDIWNRLTLEFYLKKLTKKYCPHSKNIFITKSNLLSKFFNDNFLLVFLLFCIIFFRSVFLLKCLVFIIVVNTPWGDRIIGPIHWKDFKVAFDFEAKFGTQWN